MALPDLNSLDGFDWDKANIQKNWQRHRVRFDECEEVFFYEPLIVPDFIHSVLEPRYFAYGRTSEGRLLTLVFTIRDKKIRVISVRDMSRKERQGYEKIQKDSPI